MIGQTSNPFEVSKKPAVYKGLATCPTAVLFTFIICYQVVNQLFLYKADDSEKDPFEWDRQADQDPFDAEGGCAALPGASGSSSLCMEAQLFKGWHQMPADSPAELDQLLAVSPSAASKATSTAAPAPARTLRGEAVSAPKPEAENPEALEEMLWDAAFKMGGGDESHSAPDKNKKPAEKSSGLRGGKADKHDTKHHSFSEGLTELQQKLEAKMKAQARRHAEHRALRALHVAASGHAEETAPSEKAMTPWAHDLDEMTHELQAHMDDWRKHKTEHTAAIAKVPEGQDPLTPWAHKLDDLTHEIQHHMEEREKERAEHAAEHARAHAARLRALHAADIQTPFLSEIDELGRELCKDPARRDRPACAKFLHPNSEDQEETSPKSAHETAMAHIKLWEKHLAELEKEQEHDNAEIKRESTEFLKQLCDDPARHSYPTCAQFFATTTAKPAATTKGLRGARASTTAAPTASTGLRGTQAPAPVEKKGATHTHTLHWMPMGETKSKEHHTGASQLVMHRDELRGAHWDTKIPKVSCITVLPRGHISENLMKYFMDNYKLQHYDGERELILVYHHDDKEAARIAHLFADGTSVKAAAAHGAETEFPSATAYRYGAWVAHDADLIARWDFDAWHHPNQITMLVRAIAVSQRPAALVTTVTAFDTDGTKATVTGGVGHHGSMMGDAVWMHKHWMPILEEEHAVIAGLHSADVVQVDMPELLTYHDASMLRAAARGNA